jgi:hypothetical protein
MKQDQRYNVLLLRFSVGIFIISFLGSAALIYWVKDGGGDKGLIIYDYKSSVKNENNAIVFTGDCSGISSIQPKIIEKILQKNCVNLCLSAASGALGCEALLEWYLAHNSPPKS